MMLAQVLEATLGSSGSPTFSLSKGATCIIDDLFNRSDVFLEVKNSVNFPSKTSRGIWNSSSCNRAFLKLKDVLTSTHGCLCFDLELPLLTEH